MLIKLTELKRAARWKPAGYLADVLSKTTPANRECVRITEADYDALRRKYRGLGDLVHERLLPLVRRIDRKFGTNLEGCSGCERRRRWLNSLTSRH